MSTTLSTPGPLETARLLSDQTRALGLKYVAALVDAIASGNMDEFAASDAKWMLDAEAHELRRAQDALFRQLAKVADQGARP